MNPIDDAPATVPPENPIVGPPVAPAPAQRTAGERFVASLFGYILPLLFLTALTTLVVWSAPYMLAHWRLVDASAEAEAAYTRRRAELKAEAEHADARLELLDKKVHLTSLGFRELTRKVSPVVVNVANYREADDKDFEKHAKHKLTLHDDPATGKQYVQQSTGSGLIYKPGIILTNHHVIRDADRLRISFPSGRSVGVDIEAALAQKKADLAIIRLPDKLPVGVKEEAQQVAEFADSDKDVHVGDWVLAMGSPLGLRNSVSHGIISAQGRTTFALKDHRDQPIELLQSDAAIFPGNSGGPLFDQLGRVVGVNAMIASESGGNQGIGFAIPSSIAKRVANDLLKTPVGYLGVVMEPLPEAKANELKIEGGGVKIKELAPGQAAEKSGIKVGDILVRINKEALPKQNALRRLGQLIQDLEPGAVVTIDIIRNGENRQIEATLGTRPADLR